MGDAWESHEWYFTAVLPNLFGVQTGHDTDRLDQDLDPSAAITDEASSFGRGVCQCTGTTGLLEWHTTVRTKRRSPTTL
jgi:hypothetical protein